MAKGNVGKGGEYSLYLWGDDDTVINNSKIYEGNGDDDDDDNSKEPYNCNYTSHLCFNDDDVSDDPILNIIGRHLQHPVQSHRDHASRILPDHVHRPMKYDFPNIQELFSGEFKNIERNDNTRKQVNRNSQKQEQPSTVVSRLATCLNEYSNEPIKMLHLRDIHRIDHDLDISAIHRFLVNNPTCRKVWIEDCDILQRDSAVVSTTTAAAASSSILTNDSDRAVAAVSSLSPLIRTILSVRQPTIDDRYCGCSCCRIVEELIIEGPNITDTCLDAILESFNMECTSCCCVDGTSGTSIVDGAGGLKRLIIDKWLTTKKDLDQAGVAGPTENPSMPLPCLSTAFPYQLMKRLSTAREATKCNHLGGLTQVTIRGLKLVEIDNEQQRGKEDNTTEKGMVGIAQADHGNNVKSAVATPSTPHTASNASGSRIVDPIGTTQITHWDVSECIFHDINDGNYSNMYRNDPSYFLNYVKSYCPLLQSLRMDSNDIICMMNAHHNRIINDVDGDIVITTPNGRNNEDNSDGGTDLESTPTDVSSSDQSEECPLLTDLLAIPTLNALELCWELPPPLIRGGDTTLRTRILPEREGARIEYDATCRDSFFLTEEFYTRMLRSWNSHLSYQEEDVDTQLLSHLARGIGASLESSFSRQMVQGSDICSVGAGENGCTSIAGLVKLKLSRNQWSTQDLRALFCSILCPSVAQPSLLNLQDLDLTCCGINGTSFLFLICNVLCQLKNLRSLDIGYNPNIFEYQEGNIWSTDGWSDQQSIYFSVLEFVRSHPRLTSLSLEGIRPFPKNVRDELLYVLCIKRCGCPPPDRIYFEKEHGDHGSDDKKHAPQIPVAAALWPLILDHSRFLEFNEMKISRQNDDSIRAQSQAIYYVLNETILTL